MLNTNAAHNPEVSAAPAFEIHINKKLYRISERIKTGAQLKEIANIPPENQLMMERTGGQKDLPIADGDSVEMKNGLHFYDVAPGTFGCELRGVPIIIDGRRFEVMAARMLGRELKALAGAMERDQLFADLASGCQPIPDNALVELVAGARFFHIAEAAFGLDFPMGSQAAEEVRALSASQAVRLVDLGGGDIGVQFEVPLPPGWSRTSVAIMIRVPRAYPQAGLDTFLAQPDLRLAGGSMPSNASLVNLAGGTWLSFSWHPQRWRPGVDTLLSYIGFARGRLNQVR